MIPRQCGPEPKACSVVEWVVDRVFRDVHLPMECDKVEGAERREGYDIDTGGLKWEE